MSTSSCHDVENDTVEPVKLYEMCLSSIYDLFEIYLKDYISFLCGLKAVVNLSDHQLKPHQISLLEKGQTFCLSPGEPDMADLKRDLDTCDQNVKFKAHFGKKG